MAYLAYQGERRPATVLTVHNLAYQGQFPPDLLGRLRLPPHAFAIDGVESYGMIGFLKAGLQFADRITTVSPTYAQEIQTSDNGCGLDGLLRLRSSVLSGIRNGIDDRRLEPGDRPAHRRRGSARSTLPTRSRTRPRCSDGSASRRTPTRSLFARGQPHGLAEGPRPPGRCGAGAGRARRAARGARHRRSGVGATASRRWRTAHRGQVGCIVGYDEDLAHLIQAGADAVLVPSRFEPCGLTQLCAMRYGAIPVVAKVGGLGGHDRRSCPRTGQSAPASSFPRSRGEALEAALQRAANVWSDRPTWQTLQSNAMQADVSWAEPAAEFAKLYAALLASKN